MTMEDANPETNWTAEKNHRRCELIDKEIRGELSLAEACELEQLQSEMLRYRNSIAPLPLDDLREFFNDVVKEYQDRPV